MPSTRGSTQKIPGTTGFTKKTLGSTENIRKPSCGKTLHTTCNTKTNISTNSSASSSSVSSTKTRILINAVRRVSRMSSSAGTADTKPSEGK